MSYRSVKRVLGETSLERKCRWLFGLCLFSLITGSFWWYSKVTAKLVNEASRRTGRGQVDATVLLHHMIKLETRGEDAKEWIADVGKSLENKGQKYAGVFIRPVPDAPNPPSDKFEWDAVRKFSQRPPPIEPEDRVLFVDKEYVYQYYQPVYVQKRCNDCHRRSLTGRDDDPGLARLADLGEGDLAAVVKVEIPDGERRTELNWNRAYLLATAIITVFLAMIASYAIVRYVIVKPLKHLRDVSDEISHGNTSLRADIHTGDEFESLGAAFNRMVRHMISAQEDLTQANTNLDQKVDELAQANMRLYEMNRLKSDFLATMSHELRTPLNAILGFSDVLGSIDSLDDKQKRYVRNIQSSGKVLLEMINDILDLAKIESGRMNLRLSDFNIAHLVNAQCDFFRPQIERKNIDLAATIDADIPDLFQDQARVQQILQNLLSNAIKFTPEGGRIDVSVRRGARDDVILAVADTGVGIADEDQTIIFEKFRQGKSVLSGGDAMTREYSGTGLGLSIVKELCKLLGGEVSLESRLGKGSTFTVRIPLVRSEQPDLDLAAITAREELARLRRSEESADRVGAAAQR